MKRLFRKLLSPEQEAELLPGLKMSLDLRMHNQDSIFWFFEETEPSLQWALRNLFPAGGLFVDVGANAGLLGLLAIYWRQANVVFVEPHPRLAELVRKNLRLNGFESQGKVWELGASDRLCEAVLYLHPPSNDGAHSLLHFSGSTGSCKVNLKRLDDILGSTKLDYIDMIKIDAQDHDFQVLVGLGDYLSPQKIGLIYIEMEGESGPYHKIWDMLWQKGFSPFSAGVALIDDLYRLRTLERNGQSIAFFQPTNTIKGGSILWCERGSFIERHLMILHERAMHKPLPVF